MSRITDIAGYIKDRKCILFLGAGINYVPDDPKHEYFKKFSPPLAKELSAKLADECEFIRNCPIEDEKELEKASQDLQRVAQYIENEDNSHRGRLCSYLEKYLHTNTEPSPLLLGLAQIDFPLVITTNFDRLFEKALKKADKDPTILLYKKDPVPTPQSEDSKADDYKKNANDCPNLDSVEENKPVLFKIHGDILPKDENEMDSMVVTIDDYIHFILRMTDKDNRKVIPDEILSKLQEWSILFIGYGFLDWNLHVLLKIIKGTKSKKPRSLLNYSINPKPDPIIKDLLKLKEFTVFLIQDAWEFVPELYKEIKKKPLPDFKEYYEGLQESISN